MNQVLSQHSEKKVRRKKKLKEKRKKKLKEKRKIMKIRKKQVAVKHIKIIFTQLIKN
jgi:ElaB/YqjD/DUF883 family membrane-anchored ribosome-binding protein